MTSVTRNLIAAIWLTAGGVGSTYAAPLTIIDPYISLVNTANNSLGWAAEAGLRFGAVSVTPNGYFGTSGLATAIDQSNNNLISRPLQFVSNPFTPNYFSGYASYNLAQLGPWTLTFTNGPDSAQSTVALPAGTQLLPFINSITLTGNNENPTFSWTPPPGTTVNAYMVLIRDKSLMNGVSDGLVAGRTLLPAETSYTVQASEFTFPGYAFALNKNYSIEIQLIQTIDGSSTNLANSNVKSLSRVYADFTPHTGDGPPVNLPVVVENGVYQFNIAVVAGQTYYIDPEVAIGYDYAIGSNDPYFQSVVLPVGIGDGLYDILGYDSLNNLFMLADDWAGGSVFDFGPGGVSRFSVAGIETSAALDPNNTTAFVTGLTFSADGNFTGTQTPIVEKVPEPASLALFGLAFAGLVASRREGTGCRRAFKGTRLLFSARQQELVFG